jgi:hypothetical protein
MAASIAKHGDGSVLRNVPPAPIASKSMVRKPSYKLRQSIADLLLDLQMTVGIKITRELHVLCHGYASTQRLFLTDINMYD